MAEIDGAYLSPTKKREAVERGDTVKYPWGGNDKTLQMNAADIMEGSSTPYVAWLEQNPDREHDIDAFHTAFLRKQ